MFNEFPSTSGIIFYVFRGIFPPLYLSVSTYENILFPVGFPSETKCHFLNRYEPLPYAANDRHTLYYNVLYYTRKGFYYISISQAIFFPIDYVFFIISSYLILYFYIISICKTSTYSSECFHHFSNSSMKYAS